MKNFSIIFIFLVVFFSFIKTESQEIDIDNVLERLERIEKNISDLQKGKVDEFEKNISSGYISRNESRFDEIETKNRLNFGLIEEIQNKINALDEKLKLIDSDFQARIKKIEEQLKKESNYEKQETNTIEDKKAIKMFNQEEVPANVKAQSLGLPKSNNEKIQLSDIEIKKKYENAIKLLWASKFNEAESELQNLKKIEPDDLMPNIQYWLGEVFYAQKNFEKAIVAFGEGLEKYPESIKGPDNLLKLGLSFSNLKKKDEACNILFELEIKYKDAPKNVQERASSEIKKLECPKE
jgi:tol-pal system protein YbgF